jgi:spore coat protein A, manganese oxidase
MLTRRQLLKRGGIVGAGLMLPLGYRTAAAGAAPALPLFVDELPNLLADPVSPVNGTVELELREFLAKAHRDLPATTWRGYVRPQNLPDGAPLPGLQPNYLGPTVAVVKGSPVKVSYKNALPPTALFPPAAFVPTGTPPVRINTHLHGGHIAAAADGNPFETLLAQEYLPGQTQEVWYANDQRGALLFYHDHAIRITRQNVYGGMAGGWAIRDQGELDLIAANGLPHGAYEVPMVIQDHMFDPKTGAQIYPDPWAPEWFGDSVLINGKAFPFKNVEPRRYRLRLLNGSNSRFYHLGFNRPVTIHQIGTDLGMLPEPMPVQTVLLAPAERADLIVDFTAAAGKPVVMQDLPLPIGTVSPTRPIGDVMQFRVGTTVTTQDGNALPSSLPGSKPSFTSGDVGDRVRTFTLDEVLGRGGKPVMALIDNLEFELQQNRTQVTADTVEEWQIVNLTADTHPIHVHLVGFQVVSRQPLDLAAYLAALGNPRDNTAPTPPAIPLAGTTPIPAPPAEQGWKDTVRANPGEITTIRMKFDLPRKIDTATGQYAVDALGQPLYEQAPQKYVFHCHILEHEDNDMMRPYTVIA